MVLTGVLTQTGTRSLAGSAPDLGQPPPASLYVVKEFLRLWNEQVNWLIEIKRETKPTLRESHEKMVGLQNELGELLRDSHANAEAMELTTPPVQGYGKGD